MSDTITVPRSEWDAEQARANGLAEELRRARAELDAWAVERAAGAEVVEGLRVSEARYRGLIETQTDAIARSDVDGRLTYVNDAYCRAFGRSRDELLGRIFTAHLLAEDAPATLAAQQALLSPPHRARTENRHLTPQGVRWFSWDESAILDEHGRILELQGVGRDITERKQAEATLAEERNLLRTLIDALPDHIYVKDRDGRTLLANVAQARALGLASPDELVGRADSEFPYSPDALEAIRRNDLAAMAASRAIASEESIAGPAGDERSFSTIKAPLWDLQGNVIGIIGISHDLTRRKQIEEEVRQERDRAEQYLNTAEVLLMVLDAHGVITLMNRKGHRILGYADGELLGKSWVDTCLPVRVREETEVVFRQLIAGEADALEHHENPVVTARGEERLIAWHNTLLKDSTGRIVGILSSGEDITERRQAEEALRRSEENFAAAFHGSPAMMSISLMRTGQFVEVNAAFLRRGGYRRDEVIGRTAQELGLWADTAALEEANRTVHAVGRYHDQETVIRIRSGEEIIGLLSAEEIEFDGERCILTVAEDITERKQAEAALRDSQQQSAFLAEVIERSSQPFAVGTADGRIPVSNAAFAHLTGYTTEELSSLNWDRELTAPEWCATERAKLDELERTGQPVRYEKEYIRKDGSRVPVELLAQLANGEAGQSRRYYAFVTDITERKQAERALRRANAYTRSLIEASLDPLVTIGPDGKITDVNSATEAATGYPRQQLIGTDFIGYFTEPERARAGYQQVFQEGQVRDYPLDLRHRDGHVTPVLYNASVYRDERGQITGVFAAARDVTERQQAEAALRDSQQQNALLADLLERSSQPFTFSYSDGRVGMCNSAYSQLVGYSKEELASLDWSSDLTPPRWHAVERSKLEELHRTGQPVRYEKEYVRKDGSIVPIELLVHLFREPDGQLRHYAFLTDITARKQAEAALEQARERLELALQGADLGMYEWNPQTSKAFVDARYLEMIGYAPGEIEVTTESWAAVTHPDDFASKQPMLEALAQGQLADGESEYRVRHKLGHWVWILDRSHVVNRDAPGRPARIIGTHLDITARKRAEEQIRYQAGLVASISDAIIGTDLQFNVLSWNAAAEAMYGWTAAEALGRGIDELLQSEHAAGTMEDALRQLLGEGLWRGEALQRRRDGSQIPILASVSLIKDGRGRSTGAVAVNRDITERRRLEEQLRQAQKMEAVGTLAGGVAHDFNNLLTVISGNAALLFGELSCDDPRRQEVMAVQQAADRAAALTRQLLAFSRRQVLQARVLNLNDVIAEETRMLRRLIGEDVTLTTTLAPDLGLVKVDAGYMEQVILNLVVNAREAMPHGGRLLIETANVDLDQAYVDLRADVAPGPYVVLAISDTGVGMDSATLGRIFEPFFTTKELGSGLGLATVYGIVAQSGGHIRAYSEPGQGATFRLYLPRLGEEASRTPPAPAEERPAGGAETVLLVEDEEMVRRLAARCLQDLGYRVIEASSGAEALALAHEQTEGIQLLMTDVVMPGISGPDLARQMQAAYPHLRVLLVSGYTAGFFGAGDSPLADHPILEKPFTLESLAGAVRQALEEEDGSRSTPAA